MLKSSASRAVLVGLIAIAALELGLSGKFSQVWQLAFVKGAAANMVQGSINNPTAASQQAHRSGQ